MARTVQVAPARGRADVRSPVRRTRVVVKKVGPWSILRFSFLYYFCVMLVAMIGLIILYNLMSAFGAVDAVAKTLHSLGFGGKGPFRIHGTWLLVRAFAIGVIMVVFWSLVKLFLSFLYNLISDIVGGVEITLTERR